MTEFSTPLSLVNENNKKILYFVSVDSFFYSHFMDRAKSARATGYEVVVVCNVGEYKKNIESHGIRVIPIVFSRRSINPFGVLGPIFRLIEIFRIEKPDLLHLVAIKPILLGAIAAKVVGVKTIVNALVGGGYIFISNSWGVRFLRLLVKIAMRLLLNPKGSRVVFENTDDMAEFVSNGYVRSVDARLIKGAGVDIGLYQQKSDNNSTTYSLIVLPARLLWDKGVLEFVQAATIVRQRGLVARFALVGDIDPGNRASIPADCLMKWKNEGVVEVWGFHHDITKVMAEASIVCLPSYREGLPKVLLEGMAAGLPCVTTDVPGCREVVEDGVNGLLVPARNAEALAEALSTLIKLPSLSKQMGIRGRERVLNEFETKIICNQTLALYQEMIGV